MFSVQKFQDDHRAEFIVVDSPNQYAAVFKMVNNRLNNVQIFDGKSGELAAECEFMPNNRIFMQGREQTVFGGAFNRLSRTQNVMTVDRTKADHSHIYLDGMDGNCALEFSWDRMGFRAYLTENGSETVGDLTFGQSLKCTGYKPRGGFETEMTIGQSISDNKWIQAAEAHLEENLFPEAMTLEQKADVLDRAGSRRKGLLEQLVSVADKAGVRLDKDEVMAQRNAMEKDRLRAHKSLLQNRMKRTVKAR